MQLKRSNQLSEDVKSRLDFRAFYLRFCRPMRQSSTRFQALCPIPAHSHSGMGRPSLSIDLRRGLFHCFSRNEGGDTIRFYELMRGVSFSEALRAMARDLGIYGARLSPLALKAAPDREPKTFRDGLSALDQDRMSVICEAFLERCRGEEQTEGMNYLARRGIDAITMSRAGVVYFPRHSYRRVMRHMLEEFSLDQLQRSGLFNAKAHLTFYRHRLLFPFYSRGRAIFLQARTTASGVEPRWHNMRGGVPSLYNVDALTDVPSGSVVYLVEGFTDTLTLSAHGFKAVGLAGAGGLREEWLAPLERFRIVAALDGDVAGIRAAKRYREMFSARGIKLAQLRLETDVNDFFRQDRSAALEFALLTEAAQDQAQTVDAMQTRAVSSQGDSDYAPAVAVVGQFQSEPIL